MCSCLKQCREVKVLYFLCCQGGRQCRPKRFWLNALGQFLSGPLLFSFYSLACDLSPLSSSLRRHAPSLSLTHGSREVLPTGPFSAVRKKEKGEGLLRPSLVVHWAPSPKGGGILLSSPQSKEAKQGETLTDPDLCNIYFLGKSFSF